eukprot:gene16664-4359_t
MPLVARALRVARCGTPYGGALPRAAASLRRDDADAVRIPPQLAHAGGKLT